MMGLIRDTKDGFTNDEGWDCIVTGYQKVDFVHTGCGAKTSAEMTPMVEQGLYCPNCDKFFVMEWSATDDTPDDADSYWTVREREAGNETQ